MNRVFEGSNMEADSRTWERALPDGPKGRYVETAIPGLSLFRRDEPTEPMTSMYEPSICVVAQGAKRVLFGEDTYMYDAQPFLVTSVDLQRSFRLSRRAGRSRAWGFR